MIDKDLIEWAIFAVLGIMGFISLSFSIERLLFFKSINLANYQNKTALELDLGRFLTSIATVASSAPYVGLLGTVLGVMISFAQISSNGLTGSSSIMLGLALALKATALGLVVAIISMIFCNLLARKVEVLIATWEINETPKI